MKSTFYIMPLYIICRAIKLKTLLLFLPLFFASCLNNKEMSNKVIDKKPNIVFILIDDLGWVDLGYTGSTFYETPNIDALSKKSIQFTNAYASSSVCSPSRAAILTGKNPARVNVTDWIPGDNPQNRKLLGPADYNELPLKEITIAEVLQSNGYKTFFAGKWHLGNEDFYPENQGFDINVGGGHMGQPPGGYYSPYKNPKLIDGPDGEYLTDRLTDESIKFIDTIGDNPFLLYLTYYSVHTPIQPSNRHLKKFTKKLDNLRDKEIIQKIEGKGITTLEQKNPDYASMVYALDENIGRLIKQLKEKGVYENTLLIFTSDNGGLTTLMKDYNIVAPTSVTPLRAGKGWLYEGGIRVPLLIKPVNYSKENELSTEPVIGHDFFPTILSQAGIKMPENEIFDGVDLTPVLNTGESLNRKELFWHYPHYHGSAWTPGAAIRQGNWKLIEFYESGTTELYNLLDDISETNDLSSKYPEKVISLKEKLHYYQKSMNAKEAVQNPKFSNIESD